MLNVKDFAEFMKVSTRTVRRWLHDGMPYVRVRQIIRIDLPKAMEWIESQKWGA